MAAYNEFVQLTSQSIICAVHGDVYDLWDKESEDILWVNVSHIIECQYNILFTNQLWSIHMLGGYMRVFVGWEDLDNERYITVEAHALEWYTHLRTHVFQFVVHVDAEEGWREYLDIHLRHSDG